MVVAIAIVIIALSWAAIGAVAAVNESDDKRFRERDN